MKVQCSRIISIWILTLFLAVALAPASLRAADDSWELEDVQLIFFGDSRTEGLQLCAGGCVYVGMVAAGYDWMSGPGYDLLADRMAQYPDADVIFCFGVNDLGNVDSYIGFFRSFIEAYPERGAWFASVNPIADSYAAANGYFVRDEEVCAFNDRVKEALPEYYLDTYTFLAAGGYETLDGVHYGSNTYVEIQNLTKILVEAKKAGAAMEAMSEEEVWQGEGDLISDTDWETW